jgi:hypothetical protein
MNNTIRSRVDMIEEVLWKLRGLIKNLQHLCKVACFLLGEKSFDEVVPPKDFNTLIQDLH